MGGWMDDRKMDCMNRIEMTCKVCDYEHDCIQVLN